MTRTKFRETKFEVSLPDPKYSSISGWQEHMSVSVDGEFVVLISRDFDKLSVQVCLAAPRGGLLGTDKDIEILNADIPKLRRAAEIQEELEDDLMSDFFEEDE
jgi:hypothetical protein